jgi:hypothetical protein
MLGSPKWSLSFRFPQQNPVYASPLPHTRYMPRPFHSSRFNHPKNIGWRVQITERRKIRVLEALFRYTAFEMWWHTRRNQISSFGETDESI